MNADVIASEPSSQVRAVYDELHALVQWWRGVGALTLDDDAVTACRELFAEARLLDDGRLDEWLAGWHPAGSAWVPLDPTRHPGSDQSYYLDDVRRLGERVTWMRQPSAWSQWPAAATVRTVTNVESHRQPDGELWTRSVVVLHEHRNASVRVWSGHQLHVLSADGDGWRRRIKVLCIPALRGAVPHPGILL